MADLTDAKRRIVEMLKRSDVATTVDLAAAFNTTTTAVRQHLDALEQLGLVERLDGPVAGRGRPALHWRLTPLSRELFPDRHGELTVELINSIRATLGEAALDRVIDQRSSGQLVGYRAIVGEGSMSERVRALARRRTTEGYLAEAVVDGDDMVLIEHHCPICSAASVCQGLCRSEMEVFQAVLGDGVDVRREQHLLSGDSRCAYRISPVTVSARSGR